MAGSSLAPYYVFNVHQDGMTVAWSFLINIGIIAGALRYYKLALVLHSLCGVLNFIITYTFILYVLAPYGFNISLENDGWLLYAHGIVGCMLLGFSVFQSFSGTLIIWLRQGREMDIHKIKRLRKVHQFFGYFLTILYKYINCYFWNYEVDFMYVLVAWEFASIIIYILVKLFIPKFEVAILDSQT